MRKLINLQFVSENTSSCTSRVHFLSTEQKTPHHNQDEESHGSLKCVITSDKFAH